MNAGSRSGPLLMETARVSLESHGLPLMAAELVAGDALEERIHRWSEEGADLLIVGGGDGTLRLAAEALQGRQVTLGALPLGTGNNFARDLGMPLPLPDACRVLAEGRTSVVELGEAVFADGSRAVFVNAAHVGLFGLANPVMDPGLKRRYGHFAYLIGSWRAWRDFAPFRLDMTADDVSEQWDATHVSAIMGRTYAGGFGAIPGETLEDRRLTLTVLEVAPLLRLASIAWRVARSSHAGPARVHRFRMRTARLEAHPPQSVNLDGEILGHTPVTFRVRPRALRVIVGEKPVSAPARNPWQLAGGAAVGLLAGSLLGRQYRRREEQQE
ncbi:MAG: hypothetical protein KY468_17145 [Armatimonadetes bacterium]|nr:hypothetical protein [Armatimonadota bacterium]